MNILMTMETVSARPSTAVDLREAQAVTAQFALYEDKADPESILHRGFVDEAAECAYELGQKSTDEDSDGLAGEIGDMLWYISETARTEGLILSDFGESEAADVTFDKFQRQAVERPELFTILDEAGAMIDPYIHSKEAVQVLTQRVVDACEGVDGQLWRGYGRRLTPRQAIKDLFVFIAVTADRHGLQLSDVFDQTIYKLSTRGRVPHVIAEEEVLERNLADRREALQPALQHLAVRGEL